MRTRISFLSRISSRSVIRALSKAAFALEPLDSRRLLSVGTVDTTFGSAGHVVDQTLPAVQALAVQADGKIVETGTLLGNFSVARFNVNGTPDTTFGYQGRLTTDFGGYDSPHDLFIQPDGKIVIGGTNGPALLAVRYLPNGQLDASFGAAGTGTVAVNRPATVVFSERLVALPGGSFEFVGTEGAGYNDSHRTYLLARITSNGQPDATFGNSGIATDPAPDFSSIASAALQSDGKIITIGTVSFPRILQRFNADGSLDPTVFNAQGFGGTAVKVQPDAKILFGAVVDGAYFSRIKSDGSDDPSFSTLSGEAVSDFFIQPDGKIVIAASGSIAPTGSFVGRLNPDGSFDTTFGTDGKTPFDRAPTLLAPSPDGSIIVTINPDYGKPSTLELVKLAADNGAVVPPGESPFGASPAAIPGRVEAENFDNGGEGVAYHSGNFQNYTNNNYRATGITVENIPGGGRNVGYLHGGSYLKYTVNTAAGNYDFSAAVADAGTGASFHVEVDGVNVSGPIDIPNTGSYQAYQPVTKTGIPLSAGTHIVKIAFDTNNANGYAGNIDYFAFDSANSTTTGSISGRTQPAVNVQVYLDIPGIGHYVAGDPVTTSNPGTGAYNFIGLAPHAYIVRVTNPPGQTLLDPSASVFANQYYVVLGAGQNITGKDFTFTQ